MRRIIGLGMALVLVGGWAMAVDWGDAKGRGMFPYWQTGGGWYTIVAFVNGSEETSDVIHIRFYPHRGTRRPICIQSGLGRCSSSRRLRTFQPGYPCLRVLDMSCSARITADSFKRIV